MRRVIVTGGSGFVGSALSRLLLEREIEILFLPYGKLYSLAHDAQVAREVSRNLDSFKPDTLIHLAWRVEATSWFQADSQMTLVDATESLLDMLARSGISQTIGVGSCLEYLPSPSPIDEGGILNSDYQYTRDKLLMKQVLNEHAERHGYISTWARFFFLYGPNDRPERLIPATAAKMVLNLDICLDNPDAIIDYLNVEDAAEALIVLAQTRTGGIFNVGSGIPVTPREVVLLLKKLMGSQSQILLPPATNDELNGFVADNARLVALNWTPRVSLREGLMHFLEDSSTDLDNSLEGTTSPGDEH